MEIKLEQKNGSKKRRIGLIITLLINVLIVGFIAFSEFKPGSGNVEEVSVSDIKLIFLLFGVLCFGVAVFADYMKYRRMLMLTEGRFDRKGALEVALLGKYYDNVTPFGAGGQPFQIHYLKKRGYSSGTSAAAPAMGFLTQQVAFVIAGAVVFISNRRVMQSVPILNYTAYVGLLMYSLLPLAIVMFAVIPKPFKAAVGGFVRILGKLHIVKDVEATLETWLGAIDEYVKCIRLFAKHPMVMIKLMLYSLLYQAAILSIPFFMIRAFGGTGDWWTVFSLVVYIYAAITIVPTPGNAGAAEGSFYAVFSSLEGGMLFWAMIAWRLLVYYSWLVCGLIIIARSTAKTKERIKMPPKEGPLKICLVTDLFYPTVDGVVRTVDAYARHLQAKGHEVFVMIPRQEKRPQEFPYTVYNTSSFRFPGIPMAVPTGISTKEIRRRFKADPPDVIHVHSPFFTGRLAVRLGRKYHIPVYSTFHSKFYDDALNATHSRLLARMFVDLVVNFFNRADYVWACSLSTAKTLRAYGYNGQIQVMENGIEKSEIPDIINVIRGRSAERFDLPRGSRGLLYVGQMIWQKELRLILDTMKLLEDDEPEFFLVLAGTGYNEDEIRAYAHELKIENRIKFVGKIMSREQLFGLYLDADLFFFPSQYDNAPLVVREAAAAELPSLLTEGSNSAEVVEDGVNGFTAEPNAEAMAAKIRSVFAEGRLKEVGLKAKQTIPVGWEEIVDRVLLAYRTGSKEGHEDMLKDIFAE